MNLEPNEMIETISAVVQTEKENPSPGSSKLCHMPKPKISVLQLKKGPRVAADT